LVDGRERGRHNCYDKGINNIVVMPGNDETLGQVVYKKMRESQPCGGKADESIFNMLPSRCIEIADLGELGLESRQKCRLEAIHCHSMG
jgi:hypothetical protein